MNHMRYLPIFTLAAAVAATAACGGSDNEAVTTKTDAGTVASPTDSAADANGVSMVRVVNAAPGSGSLTVRAGDESPFTAVAYKTVTPYREVRGNMVRFRVTGGASDSTDLAANNEVMADGNRYTIFIMPNDDDDADAANAGARKLNMKVVRDELDADSTKAQVRFVNAAADAGELDLAMAGQTDPVFDDVNFGNEAGFKTVDPVARGQLTVRREEGNRSLASVRDIRALEAGKLYTIVVTGNSGKWDVITFDDTVRDLSADDAARRNAAGAGAANPR